MLFFKRKTNQKFVLSLLLGATLLTSCATSKKTVVTRRKTAVTENKVRVTDNSAPSHNKGAVTLTIKMRKKIYLKVKQAALTTRLKK